MRFDLLIVRLRLCKSRSGAQSIAESGQARINGRRIERAHCTTSPGDILIIPIGQKVLAIELLSLPERRGPPSEAQSCYRVLDAGAHNLLAGQN